MLVHPQFDPDRVRRSAPSRCAGTGSCTWSAFVLFVVLGKLRARQQPAHRLAPARRRRHAVLRRVRRDPRRAARLRAVLQAALLPRAPARDLRGVAGRHELPRRLPRRARRAVAVRARARQALARRHRLRRAAGAARARRRAARQLHQRRAVGARRPTCPWAMVFPQVDGLPRHPSQLYQFALEGLLLFAMLWWYTSRRAADGRGVGPVPDRLRRVPLRRRVRARAGQLPGLPGAAA